jgi:hypothetical protein
MVLPLSNILDLVAALRESASRGDWQGAADLAAVLRQQTPPSGREDLGEYLLQLKEALMAAKASRAHAAVSLAKFNTAAVRLNAAASFNKTGATFGPSRQEFGEPADF